jgi:hypothetical protein
MVAGLFADRAANMVCPPLSDSVPILHAIKTVHVVQRRLVAIMVQHEKRHRDDIMVNPGKTPLHTIALKSSTPSISGPRASLVCIATRPFLIRVPTNARVFGLQICARRFHNSLRSPCALTAPLFSLAKTRWQEIVFPLRQEIVSPLRQDFVSPLWQYVLSPLREEIYEHPWKSAKIQHIGKTKQRALHYPGGNPPPTYPPTLHNAHYLVRWVLPCLLGAALSIGRRRNKGPFALGKNWMPNLRQDFNGIPQTNVKH